LGVGLGSDYFVGTQTKAGENLDKYF
jgi:hypothetical protein